MMRPQLPAGPASKLRVLGSPQKNLCSSPLIVRGGDSASHMLAGRSTGLVPHTMANHQLAGLNLLLTLFINVQVPDSRDRRLSVLVCTLVSLANPAAGGDAAAGHPLSAGVRARSGSALAPPLVEAGQVRSGSEPGSLLGQPESLPVGQWEPCDSEYCSRLRVRLRVVWLHVSTPVGDRTLTAINPA